MTNYMQAAVDFLRGEWSHPGYIFIDVRGWLPPGTTFDAHNARQRAEARESMAKWRADGLTPHCFDVDKAAGKHDEPPIAPIEANRTHRHGNEPDAWHWHRYASGKCTAEEQLGRRYLLVAHHGEESMWVSSWDTQAELAMAIASHVEDHDYGVSMVIDLETREPIPFRVSVTLGEE